MGIVDFDQLKKIANQIRGDILQISHDTNSIHVGGSLSCTDILVTLYYNILSIKPDNPLWENRDMVILSKGHCVLAWYTVLAHMGYFPFSDLKQYNTVGSKYTEHPNRNNVLGVEVTSGSLGHGLSIGNGLALSAKMLHNPSRTFVILGDGECEEGEVWEAALFASAHKLNNLVAIVDYNKIQACGLSSEIMNLASIKDKFSSFGWNAYDVDGHDIKALISTINSGLSNSDRPIAIIAHTIKGKGVSFMENNNYWHYHSPSDLELEKAKKELGIL